MIFEFVLAYLVIGLVLYLPGFFILHAVRLSRWHALAFAPFIAVPACGILAIVYDKLEIFATGLNVGIPVLLVTFVAFLGSIAVRKRQSIQREIDVLPKKKRPNLLPLAYIGAGVVVYALFYLSSFVTLGHVTETYDNVFHFNLIHSFAESGIWSTLDTSVYLDKGEGYPYAFLSEGAYYPAGWHLLCALCISLLGFPVGVVVNAANCVFVTVTYALAMYLFLNKLFGSNRFMMVVGIFLAFAFGAYPWVVLAAWPLYPTAISMTMVPLLCLAFMLATDREVSRKRRVIYACLFIAGIAAEAFCQPSAVFAMMVLMIPYVVQNGSKAAQARLCEKQGWSARKHKAAVRVIAAAALVIVSFAVWFLFFKLPFLQPTVNYYWEPLMGVFQAIASSITLSLALPFPQYLLGFFVVLGMLYVVFKRRDLAWVIGAYALAACVFVAAAGLGNCWIKHFLSGFWYTDPYRVAALVGIAGVPLAVMGLYALIRVVQCFLEACRPTHINGMQGKLVAGIIIVLVSLLIYSPDMPGKLSIFKHVQNNTSTLGMGKMAAYSDAEKEFVEKAKELIAEDDVVLNHPYDGSMLAYGLSDFPVYYRSVSGYGSERESAESTIMREHLSSLAGDEQVQEAVRRTGADYVLLLTDGKGQFSFPTAYKEELWKGIESIDENTPGFELVLSDGDMKLYKIVMP